MRTFLICPVRGHKKEDFLSFVTQLESRGWAVYYPIRDTNQNDNTGLEICNSNRKALLESDVVHVIWDGKSQGVLFDLGMAFMANKPIIVLFLPRQTKTKSFQNMILEWAKGDKDHVQRI